MHIIFHDTTLTHASNYLKAGVTQLVLALLESGWCDQRVMLANPLAALTAWGHDPELHAVAALTDGREVTAVEHQQMFAAAARHLVERGEAEHVPDAEHILDLWEELKIGQYLVIKLPIQVVKPFSPQGRNLLSNPMLTGTCYSDFQQDFIISRLFIAS